MPAHAVIIGAGFGGLAAAIRLRARGFAVTVLEQLDKPGGKAYAFSREGFFFDAGPTVVTAPHFLEELWELADERMSDHVDLRHVHPLYRIRFHDGTTFDYQSDHESMLAEVTRVAPEDVAGYERYIALSGKIFDMGFGLIDQPFDSIGSMLRILPALIRLQSYRRVYSVVARHVRSEKIRQVLSFHTLLVGGNPFTTTSIYCLISHVEQAWGVRYPRGGIGALVSALSDLLERMGGRIRLNSRAAEILVESRTARGVRLESGEVIPADLVVSNADSTWTYRHLVPAVARRRWTDRKLSRCKQSMSCFLWYFGTRRQYPDLAQHTILLGPRYRELLDDIFTRKHLADDLSLYLHRATAGDPDMAPPGCDSFYALAPVPDLDSETDWVAQAEPYRQRIERVLADTILPDLQTEVQVSSVTTPQDFQDRMACTRGACFGLQPILTQSAYFRPHNRSEDIDRLYLVGAGTHPGAGLPGVLASAKVLDKVVPDPVSFRGEP
ncbi:MAG: phytoene desaturase [Deltaproteobacteria bacterium]|nr:phytoene desaturase [Deltaproteobacteria bacterium]